MKKIHIIGIAIIGIAISIIVSTAGNASQYVTFKEAFSMAANGNDNKIHVIGELRKVDGEVVGVEYNPSLDPNYLSFVLVDENKEAHKVICYSPPASMRDFEKSEKVVVIGAAREGQFIASEILMKCPSKYEEKQVAMR